jgi:hypothetical protein
VLNQQLHCYQRRRQQQQQQSPSHPLDLAAALAGAGDAPEAAAFGAKCWKTGVEQQPRQSQQHTAASGAAAAEVAMTNNSSAAGGTAVLELLPLGQVVALMTAARQHQQASQKHH